MNITESITVFYLQQPQLFFILFTLFSLAIGSFLNVVIYRLPLIMERNWSQECLNFFNKDLQTKNNGNSKESIQAINLAMPSSYCPQCQHKISWRDNIPIVSWLLLKGHCRYCRQLISWQYPIVELFTALSSIGVIMALGLSLPAIYGLILIWALICLSFIDIEKFLLPDQIVLPLLWLGLLINTQHTFAALGDAVVGAAAGYLILWSIYWLFKLITGKEGMGYGDFKLLAALGAWFGWQSLLIIILIASLLGLVVNITLLITQYHSKEQCIPFGPYLSIGGAFCLYFSNIVYWLI